MIDVKVSRDLSVRMTIRVFDASNVQGECGGGQKKVQSHYSGLRPTPLSHWNWCGRRNGSLAGVCALWRRGGSESGQERAGR